MLGGNLFYFLVEENLRVYNIAWVDNEKCIGCTQCVYFCNFASIDMISWDLKARTSQFESKKALILEDTCTGCTLCVFACPVEAITMEARV